MNYGNISVYLKDPANRTAKNKPGTPGKFTASIINVDNN